MNMMMMQQRRVTRSMTASRWAFMPAEILGAFQAASTPHHLLTIRALSEAQRLPCVVKLQLVCKAWYQAAGRGIAALSMSSSQFSIRGEGLPSLSPSMVLQNFPLLVTLHLDIPYVRWSDLQNIKELGHLKTLCLCECAVSGTIPEDWAFARNTQTASLCSPFHCLTSLTSLQLELNGHGARKYWDQAPLLPPISCMTKLGALTLSMEHSYWDFQHLSQLSHLTSLGIHSLEQGINTLVKLEHLSVKATQPPARLYNMGTQMPKEDLTPFLAMLTCLGSLDCGWIESQQVSNLTALTILTALTMSVRDLLFRSFTAMFWSSLSKLPLLVSLDVTGAVLDMTDFETVALMTKLRFCGYSNNLRYSAEDYNKLSTLTSLQFLHIEFFHGGRWSEAECQLEHALQQMHNSRNMQYFQVVKCEAQELDDPESDNGWDNDLYGSCCGDRCCCCYSQSDSDSYDNLW